MTCFSLGPVSAGLFRALGTQFYNRAPCPSFARRGLHEFKLKLEHSFHGYAAWKRDRHAVIWSRLWWMLFHPNNCPDFVSRDVQTELQIRLRPEADTVAFPESPQCHA